MKKKKDILFLCQFFYPEYISSATLPYDTAAALKKAGFSVGALCGYPHEYSSDEHLPLKETVEGVQIHRVKYIQTGRQSFIGRLVNYFSLTFMMFLHLFELAHYKAVIVYSNPPILPWIASWAKVLFGTKLIFVSYDLYPEIAVRTDVLRDGNMVCRLMNHINKCVYRRADAVVTLSSEMKDYVLRNRPIDDARVVIIPNWYADCGDSVLINKTEKPNTFAQVTANRFVVSYFGNMGTAQDMDTILDAMRLLKDDSQVCFLLAGHGNKMEHIRRVVEQEKISNVYIYDFLRGKDFEDALQISDCALVSLEKGLTGLCVPSKTYSYMMQGIPLLAIMDSCDIVRDIACGAGQWVRNGDADALAAAIKAMQRTPEKCGQMRRVCRELYLQKYTTEICTQQYVKLFRSFIK